MANSYSGVGVVIAVCLDEGLLPHEIDEVWDYLTSNSVRPDEALPSGLIIQVLKAIEILRESGDIES
jgi:hypothetical protein